MTDPREGEREERAEASTAEPSDVAEASVAAPADPAEASAAAPADAVEPPAEAVDPSEPAASASVLDPDLARALGVGSGPPRLLEPSEIRARRRPRAVLFVWLWELACALLLATPVHAWAKAVWGAHPDGDAVLFRPGGHALLTWLADAGPALGVVVRTTFLLLVVFGLLGQIVTGTLIAFLATGTGPRGHAPPATFALRAGAASFFPLLGIGIVFGAIEGFVLGMGLFASSGIDHALQPRIGDAHAFTARLVVLGLFVLVTLLVGVIADLARVTIVRDVAMSEDRPVSMRRAMRDGVVSAMTTARRALGRAALGWGWRAALSIALVYAGALAGDVVGGRGGGALWLLFVVHQLIVLVRAGLRASWLANALRLVTR